MKKILRENWRFILKDEEEAFYRGYDDSNWQTVTVPHDWSVALPRKKEYSSGTGYAAGGIGWYRVRFKLPEECRGKSIRIVFDGVYKNSQVWCNSYYLGKRPYGYSTFSYDITHAVYFGDEENVVCVRVVHTDIADSRWFTGSGITRKVSVVCEEPVHPEEYGIFFQAKDVVPVEAADGEAKTGSARLTVRHRIVAPQASAVRVRTDFEDREGNRVLRLEGTAEAAAEGGDNLARQRKTVREVTLSGDVSGMMLWSMEQPYLYNMKSLYAVGEGDFYLVDEQKVGIRSIRFDPDRGFFLNEREVKLKGVCVHHDGGCLGAAMEPEVWQRRLEALRDCGCNAIRCSHNPHMPELYDLCDALGFVMMDEAFDEWENAKNKWSTGHNVYPPKHQGYYEDFPQWHDADLRTMVCRDRNHPSVILWSIGNEIDYPNDPYCHPSFADMTGNNDANKPAAERRYDPNKPNAERLVTIAAELEEIVRQEDDSRPVTLAAAFPELSAKTGLLDGLDVIGYNYKEHLYAQDHAVFPDKPILGSENGHDYRAWLAVRDTPYISGQFLWTGIDYLGEAGGTWPNHGSGAGILNCAGEKKPEFYRRKSFWQGEPVLALATRRLSDGPQDWLPMNAHWNYEEGEEILVKVYSNLQEVSLELNGRKINSLSEYNGNGDFCFHVAYEPGVLRARGAEPECAAELCTVGNAADFSCAVWRQPDALTGRSWEEASREFGYLYQIEIQLRDENGRAVCWQEKKIEVSVAGDGVFAGMESGDLSQDGDETVPAKETFRGRLLIFVKRTGEGEIGLSVKAVGKEKKIIFGA